MHLSEQIARWTSAVARPITKYEQMKIARPFKYNSEAKVWSRVLKPVVGGFPYGYVEMSLSSLPNGDMPLTCAIHNAPGSRMDTYASLPDDAAIARLKAGFSEETYKFLVYGDVWNTIDHLYFLNRWQYRYQPLPLLHIMKPEYIPEELLNV